MKNNPFPVGLVATLTLLWIGALGAIAGGWVTMRQIVAEPPAHSITTRTTSPDAAASSTSSTSAQGPSSPATGDLHRLVWTPEAFWRFVMKGGSAALGALLYLLLAVGAGFLWQEKVESSNE